MLTITDFTDTILYPQLFEVIDKALPEFNFRKSGGNWVSSNKLRLTGVEGNNVGSVCVYKDRPYFIQDFSSGGKAITNYLQETGKANSWIEAIKYLSSQIGVEVPSRELSENEIERSRETEIKTKLYEAANDFFIENLSNPESEIAKSNEANTVREYLKGRGYTGDLLRKHFEELDLRANKIEVGFLPSQDKLRSYLRSKDFTLDVIDGELKSLPASIGHTHKLTIPFRDPVGRIVGFAFRDIAWTKDSKVGKYLYSTGLKRSSLLFNLRAIKGDKDLIIVEGLLDALHAKALGLDNVVALGGTSLNETQVKTALRYGAEKITLCLDQDEAGEKATDKAIEILSKSKEEIKIYVASLPQGFKDPDELIKAKGIADFRHVIINAKAHYIYLLDKRFNRLDQTKLERGEITDKERDALLSDIITIGSQAKGPLERSRFTNAFQLMGEPLGINETSLHEAIDRLKYSQEKEKQGEELRKTIDRAQSLVSSGREEEAQELLSKQSKQLNTGLLENSYHALVKPITESEVIERLKVKPDQIDSGLKLKGESLFIPSGAITILAAPTSHGKTAFQINLALNMASDPKNKPIYFFSYEENKEAILVKALNTHVNLELSKNNRRSIESFFKTEKDEYILANNKKDFYRGKMSFFGELVKTGRFNAHYVDYTSEELIGAIRYLHKNAQVGAVFIDYMQLLRLKDNRSNSRQEELKQICLDLKDCAVETGLPIILGAQFNRTVTTIAAMHSTAIGEAGDIERIANLIIGFWNKRFPELGSSPSMSDEIYATVLKGRDMGAGASETFDFKGNTGKISNKAAVDTSKMFS
jgi:DNA primase catalytic core